MHGQVEAFQCSAKCCQDRNSPQEVIQGCLANCMQPVLDAEKRLQAEIEQLQVSVKPVLDPTTNAKSVTG